jgi:predicted PurR-regulated permease PerM
MSEHEAPIVLIVVAALILAALAYVVQAILSPFVLLGALVLLLYPFRRDPVARRVLDVGTFLFVVWFVLSLLGVLAPLIIALFFAYLLNPLVTAAARRGLPRWAGSLLAVLIIILAVTGAGVFLLPPAIAQLEGVITGAAQLSRDLIALVQSDATLAFLQRLGVSPDQVQSFLTGQVTPRVEVIFRGVFEAVLGLLSSVSSVLLQLVNIIIIPFFVFYLLKDLPDLRARVVALFPVSRQGKAGETLAWVDGILGGYFRGSVIVAVIEGIIHGVGLAIIGVDYALVLGILSGIVNLFPYVGLLVSLIVSVLVAVLSGGAVGGKVIAVIVLTISRNLLETTVLGPKIVGAKVGLHPVMLMVCLLVFGYFLGFVGLLIAVPATALVMSGVDRWQERRTLTDHH